MTHEPECLIHTDEGCVGPIALAYQRGRDDQAQESIDQEGKAYNLGYRHGYNAHAEARAYQEQVYGKYPRPVKGLADLADERMVEHWNQHGPYPQGNGWPDSPTVHYLDGEGNVQTWNQHGKGENP